MTRRIIPTRSSNPVELQRQTANTVNGLVQTTQYMSAGSGYIALGYGASGAAAVRIGANDASRGRGALQIGGAGAKDGGKGMYLTNDGSPAFSTFQNSMLWGTTEVNYYGNNTGGMATSTGTTTLTLTQGVAWDSKLVGKTIYFRGAPYVVNAVATDGLSLTLASAPPAGTYAWNFSLVTGSGTCSVSGSTVTRISGEPFVMFGTGYVFELNGSTVTVSSVTDTDTIVLSAPPGDSTSATYYFELQIASGYGPLIVGQRWQKVAGAQEEGVGMFVSADGYRLGAFAAGGQGELYPFWLTSNYQEVVELHATGKYVSLGGKAGSEALRGIYLASAVNRLDVTGGTAGNAPVIAAGGSDTNVDIKLSPKGTGSVWLGAWTSNADAAVNGYVTVKDTSGNVRKLATIA